MRGFVEDPSAAELVRALRNDRIANLFERTGSVSMG